MLVVRSIDRRGDSLALEPGLFVANALFVHVLIEKGPLVPVRGRAFWIVISRFHELVKARDVIKLGSVVARARIFYGVKGGFSVTLDDALEIRPRWLVIYALDDEGTKALARSRPEVMQQEKALHMLAKQAQKPRNKANDFKPDRAFVEHGLALGRTVFNAHVAKEATANGGGALAASFIREDAQLVVQRARLSVANQPGLLEISSIAQPLEQKPVKSGLNVAAAQASAGLAVLKMDHRRLLLKLTLHGEIAHSFPHLPLAIIRHIAHMIIPKKDVKSI
ncbi:MAG: hypothetical protein LBU47_03145 [Christensenellaceae bacterium]|nr:hypothetical protein [Christensenellaceae bacterium]